MAINKKEVRKAWEIIRDAIHDKHSNLPNWETMPMHVLERIEYCDAKALRRHNDIADFLGLFFD